VLKVQRVMSESVKPEAIAKGFAGGWCTECWQQQQQQQQQQLCIRGWLARESWPAV
jgi:hypothetical protein